jgi:CheY-like chemotaxis protein
MLRSLSRLLWPDFEVVGQASDGLQALDASRSLDPDAVVLDVTMPRRDGLQTARDLMEAGSRARIVFLTMHDSDEFVAQGFRSGGQGYVLKTRLHLDLTSALKRVLAGQLFVPSLKSLFFVNRGQIGHALQFYPDDYAFVDGVGGFLDQALRRGDAVAVVSTGPIRAGLANRLQASGWSVGESGEHGRYRAVSVDDIVASITRNGRLDAGRVAELVADLERFHVASAESPQCRMTVVGDVSARFFASGNPTAGMELERLWDDLTRRLPFLTLCCFPMTYLSDETHVERLPQLCAHHNAITHIPEGGTRSLTA